MTRDTDGTSPKRRNDIERICQAALERSPHLRVAFLAEACAGDDALRREVESLLALEPAGERFMEAPVFEGDREEVAASQFDQPGNRPVSGGVMHGVRGMRPPERIGRYRVTRKIGEGGMGVVYAALDDRLDRPVAIKMIRPDALGDARARQRFAREARAAARISHQHVCQLYELDEEGGQPFLVMELLNGEPLATRLQRGPIPIPEALALATAMLDALAVLHRRGVVHRDLKPANVFLTPDGLKLLDFGLARPPTGDDRPCESSLTGTGRVVGTPQYMAPEQIVDGRADERADVFSAGAVIYEMLAGRPAFTGATVTAILHAVAYLDPLPLVGSVELAAIDSVLRSAMAKQPSRRIVSVDVLAAMLRDAGETTEGAPLVRAVTRLVALPLRVLRPDPETDFLAFSLPDAVSVALATLESVEVRPLQTRTGEADVRAIGRELAVDVVLTGTLLRIGQQVRVSAQLADAAAGSIVWADVAQAPINDLFQLQDVLTTHVVRSLALPLTRSDRQSLDRQVPANAEAYELYLRANELATDPARWAEARDAYRRAVALDASYAPAWARLGRVERVLAKYDRAPGGLPRAQMAFQRALELDPDLSIAHDLSAYADAELGRAVDGMERLLQRGAMRRTDPGLFAGLVTTCRYAGLPAASRVAHERAVALNPSQTTSVVWTHILSGDYRAAIAADRSNPPFGGLMARALLGELTASSYRHILDAQPAAPTRHALGAYPALMEGDIPEALARFTRQTSPGSRIPRAGMCLRSGWCGPVRSTLPSSI
jgi:TolB-like protein/predicted Ser/Thr protein kinase